MSYCVMRTDKMHGTTDISDLVNVKISADLENGVIVAVGALATGEREAYVATVATGTEDLSTLAILCGPEVDYDERKKLLGDYINKKDVNGGIYRAFRFHNGDEFSVSAEGFSSNPSAESVGKSVAVTTNGKYEIVGDSTSNTVFGKIVAKEDDLYVIREEIAAANP